MFLRKVKCMMLKIFLTVQSLRATIEDMSIGNRLRGMSSLDKTVPISIFMCLLIQWLICLLVSRSQRFLPSLDFIGWVKKIQCNTAYVNKIIKKIYMGGL